MRRIVSMDRGGSGMKSFTKICKNVLIDSPAGLEHLKRRVASEVDDIFDILDPSKKSIPNHHNYRKKRMI